MYLGCYAPSPARCSNGDEKPTHVLKSKCFADGAMSYQVPPFDDGKDKWTSYVIRIESYFEGNDITEDAQKRALLVSALGTRSIDVLSGRCAPRKVNQLTYKEAVEILEGFYDPRPNEIAESFRFFTRVQKEDESVQQFIVNLRRLADKCNFGDMLDRMLRDKIVCGIRSTELQKALLSRSSLTLKEAESMVLAAEAAGQGIELMKNVDVKTEPGLHKLMDRRPARSTSRQESKECGRCGSKTHSEQACKFKTAKCFKCGKKGHISVACRARGKKQNTFALTGSPEENEARSSQLFTISENQASVSSNEIVGPVRRKFCCGGVDLVMEIDTGSPVCVIPWHVYQMHRAKWPQIEKTDLRLSCYLGPLPIAGKLTLPVFYEGKTVTTTMTVIRHSGPCLCGRDLIRALNNLGATVLSLSSTSRGDDKTLEEILSEYQDVFESELGLFKVPPVHLYVKEGAIPKCFKARPLSYAMRDKVTEELERLVKSGVLSPVAHSEWATPIVPVLKKEGSVRICGDYKLTVNAACVTEQYPLPVIDDIFAALHIGDVYSTLDLRDAYNQIPLDEESKKLTTISTHKGLFCFNRLPFGVSSAPAIFQRTMENMLRGLTGVQAYLDDVLVAERKGDSGSNLKAVLQRFRECGVKIRKDKCSFRKSEVSYLGHKITSDGLQPLEKNLEAVMKAPSPKNVSELRSYIGLLTYYSKFLPSMATMLAPLYDLLKKDCRWKWSSEQQHSFDRSKEALRHAKMLTHFDPSKSLRLECDASPYGIGAVLSHRVAGVDKPIGFRSRTLTPAERNYSQLEREALALVFGVSKFRDYLLGRSFVLVTDHKPLVGLFREDRPTPVMAAARIQRWSLLLGAYQYKIEHKPGGENLNADALSRLPLPTPDDAPEEISEYVHSLRQLDETPVTSHELRRLTEADKVLRIVKSFILKGWPQEKKHVELYMRAYVARKLELTVAHGIIFWGHRVVIPEAARDRMLQMLHETHQGVSAMKAVARTSMWWPGLDQEIEHLSRKCDICVQARPLPPAETPINWPPTQENWSRVHLDFAGPMNGAMILVAVDSHSKWIEAVPMQHATAESTITALREMFSRFGIPRTIVTDNGTQFTSETFAKFLSGNNVKHLRTAPYHPQSNGLAERAVRTIKDGLKKLSQGSLSTRLSRLLFNYRRTPQGHKSPSQRLLNYQIRSRLDTCLPPPLSFPLFSQEDTPSKFGPGDAVWARNFGEGEKWLPGTIKRTSGTRMVTIETSAGIIERHLDQVRVRDSSAGATGEIMAGSSAETAAQPNEASTTEESAAAVLRRSTRVRKPVQRYPP